MAENRRASGREVDEDAVAEAGRWREDADPENVRLLDFYGINLIGQYAGMGKALSLDAVRAALDIHGFPRDDWSAMTARLLQLHAMVVETMEK